MSLRLVPLHALLPLGPNNEPPRDFTLIRRGTMATVYGEFYWDDESAKSVSARWARRNRRFMWDYQHLSDKDGRPGADGKPTPMASVHDRRSAGDGAAQADGQGFHLLGQHWTLDADGYIRRREYLYFSPVLAIDEESKPPGRIVDVIKSSLTNDPATLGCPQLVSLSADDKVAAEQIEAMSAPTQPATPAQPAEVRNGTHTLSLEQLKMTPEVQALAATVTPTQGAAGQVALAGPVTHDPAAYEADPSLAWDQDATVKRVWSWAGDDFAKARPAFAVVLGSGLTRSDYMLVHHDVREDRLVTVRGGVLDAINRMSWCSIPNEWLEPVRAHLSAEAARFGDRAPWLELSERAKQAVTERGVSLSQGQQGQGQTEPAPHPHGSAPSAEVSSVLVHRESDGHTLWGKRNDSGRHTSPGGRLRKGERPVDAAARELKEEAGIDKPAHELSYMGTVRCADDKGAPIDVHGYRCTVPDHVVPTGERDPDREVGSWEYLSEHPLTTMHAPRNALSVLSARHEHLDLSPRASKDSAGGAKSKVQLSEQSANRPKGTEHMTTKVIGSTDNMDTQKARALTLSLLGGLPSLSGDGVSAEVATAAQSAMQTLKGLDDALAAAGATGEGIAIDAMLSLAEVVKEVTGSASLDGCAGRLYSLQERASVAPVAVQLSETQAKTVILERALRTGRISAKTFGEHKNRIVKLSVSDCNHIANGPKLYDVPSTEQPAVGANGTKVELTDQGVKGKGAEGAIVANVPADLAKPSAAVAGGTDGKTFELTDMHRNLIRDLNREMPAGSKQLTEVQLAEVLTKTQRPTEQPKMRNPTA